MHIESSLDVRGPGLSAAESAQISVVIPAYNASAYLTATLESVSNQSAKPGETIVVDDGSTDDTVAIARFFGARVISLKNGGPSAARNAGTQAANGEFIAFLDADDLWTREKIAVQFAALKSFGAQAFSFTDFRVFDERGIHRRHSELRHHRAFRRVATSKSRSGHVIIAADGNRPVLYHSYIPPSSLMVRRADVLAIGGFDETLRAAEDFEFYLRLFRTLPALVVMQPLLLYRRHPQQATSNPTFMKSSVFEVARRVSSCPERYPRADALYIGSTEFLRHLDMGIQQARLGLFDAATESFCRSLDTRRTFRASLALCGSRICRNGIGRSAFDITRSVWRHRPGRR